MNAAEALEKTLRSFEVYYNVKREDVTAPFAAEAEFHSHSEQYFLVKSARLGEAESNEYVYFAVVDHLDEAALQKLDECAWSAGTAQVRPHAEHRNTDVALIIIADSISEAAFKQVSGIKHYQSYRMGFQGWSHYRLVALELNSGKAAYNRQGQSLKKLVRNILN